MTFPMHTTRFYDVLCAAAVAVLALLLTVNLGGFPALHADEAWIGMFSGRINERGLYTLHEMNDYTGAFYGWVVAAFFRWIGTSNAVLRFPGLLANVAALMVFGALTARVGGRRSLWAWVYLTATSGMLLLNSRLAWEVCALQPLLLATILLAAWKLLYRQSFRWNVLLAAACLLGTHNHFIFISVPLSLCLLSTFLAAWRQDADFSRLLPSAMMSLLLTACVFVVQPWLTLERWPVWRTWVLMGYAAAPLICGWLAQSAGWQRLCCWVVEVFRYSWLRRVMQAVGMGGLAAFAVWHLVPLVQIFSNTVLFKRYAAWAPPLYVSLPLMLWAVFLVASALRAALRAAQPAYYAQLRPGQKLFLLWPVAYSACFILFRHTSSVRYYILGYLLWMLALAWAWPRTNHLKRKPFLAFCAAVGLLLQGIFWTEVRAPQARRPQFFRIGWRLESSLSFTRTEELHAAIRGAGVCEMRQHDSFLDLPLFFFYATEKIVCRPSKVIFVKHCPECRKAPYLRWNISDK
jgi:hypothetical protein